MNNDHNQSNGVVVGVFSKKQGFALSLRTRLGGLFHKLGSNFATILIAVILLSGTAVVTIRYSLTHFGQKSVTNSIAKGKTTSPSTIASSSLPSTTSSTSSGSSTGKSAASSSSTPATSIKSTSTKSTSTKTSTVSTKSSGSSSGSGGSGSSGSSGSSSGSSGGSSGSSSPSGSLNAADDSKANCIEYYEPNGDIDDAQLTALTSALGVTFNCVTTYNQPMTTWAEWDTPWMFTGGYGWNSWLAESPTHQVIMAEDLIPSSIENNSDPLTWEEQCDAGDFNTYATALGQDLVKEGAGSILIRLGIEANGTWETDYVGNTTQEQNDWASCYDQEVTAMRAVPNAHFLFVWNPNICTADLPLNEWYPGNSYVDIIGADAYDIDCNTSKTVSQEGWSAYYNDSSVNSPNNPEYPSLANIVAFAAANNKPFALPEWGEATNEPDDATYVTDMADLIKNNDSSYQSWFDDGSAGTEELGSSIPLSTAAYTSAFGD